MKIRKRRSACPAVFLIPKMLFITKVLPLGIRAALFSIPYGNGNTGAVRTGAIPLGFQFPMGMAIHDCRRDQQLDTGFNSLWEWQYSTGCNRASARNYIRVSIPYGNGNTDLGALPLIMDAWFQFPMGMAIHSRYRVLWKLYRFQFPMGMAIQSSCNRAIITNQRATCFNSLWEWQYSDVSGISLSVRFQFPMGMAIRREVRSSCARDRVVSIPYGNGNTQSIHSSFEESHPVSIPYGNGNTIKPMSTQRTLHLCFNSLWEWQYTVSPTSTTPIS